MPSSICRANLFSVAMEAIENVHPAGSRISLAAGADGVPAIETGLIFRNLGRWPMILRAELTCMPSVQWLQWKTDRVEQFAGRRKLYFRTRHPCGGSFFLQM